MDIITDQGVSQTKKWWQGLTAQKITTYKYEDKRYAVPQRWYWGNIVKRMLNHNKAHGFTGCVLDRHVRDQARQHSQIPFYTRYMSMARITYSSGSTAIS